MLYEVITFSAALAARPELIEKGVAHGVILATPTTLITLLKTVSYVWLQQAGYENARAIRELGLELFERLSTMAGHMNRLGRDIERTAATFNRTLGAMEKRVLASARKFENLGVFLEAIAKTSGGHYLGAGDTKEQMRRQRNGSVFESRLSAVAMRNNFV